MDYRDVAQKLRTKAADKAVGPEEREALLAKAVELEGKVGEAKEPINVSYIGERFQATYTFFSEQNVWVTVRADFPTSWYDSMDDWANTSDWYSGAELGEIMRRIILVIALALFGVGLGLTMANAAPTQGTTDGFTYCVKFGPAGGSNATGNFVLNDWNNTPCPAGTYAHHLKVQDVDPFLPPGFPLDSSSINPTRAESGIAFSITDLATSPATVWDCAYTIPPETTPPPANTMESPKIVCTSH